MIVKIKKAFSINSNHLKKDMIVNMFLPDAKEWIKKGYVVEVGSNGEEIKTQKTNK